MHVIVKAKLVTKPQISDLWCSIIMWSSFLWSFRQKSLHLYFTLTHVFHYSTSLIQSILKIEQNGAFWYNGVRGEHGVTELLHFVFSSHCACWLICFICFCQPTSSFHLFVSYRAGTQSVVCQCVSVFSMRVLITFLFGILLDIYWLYLQ